MSGVQCHLIHFAILKSFFCPFSVCVCTKIAYSPIRRLNNLFKYLDVDVIKNNKKKTLMNFTKAINFMVCCATVDLFFTMSHLFACASLGDDVLLTIFVLDHKRHGFHS